MLTDSHCHLADPALAGRLPEILSNARAEGVKRFIVPAAHAGDFDSVCRLHRPPECYGAIGLHPWFAEQFSSQLLDQSAALLQTHPKLLAGEIGLDYYGERKQTRAAQQTALLAQLELAKQYRRPVILHHVRAAADTVAALKQTSFHCGGIAHGFSGSLEEAHALIGCGLFIGIGTLALNPNARKVRTAAAQLPLEHLVLETDSPFMVPAGETENTPANVRRVAETVAALRGISWQEVAAATERNIGRLLAF
ncbi:TatD family hydrolase [Eikenella sp. S3360]|uniref:TatD family hydrolase n=1 Tax=Eikenella glucosivorans TaxID=2766967 RepID=A0ABS0ND91_9NEIS|nr:TatD family hydrolase [Eikenella glucosivorans]MBH5330219.1 TatD family hydrolase [Eikenella glucosivorans]